MKKICFLLFALLMLGTAFAKPIDTKYGAEIARQFFIAHNFDKNPVVQLSYTKYSDFGQPVFYVFSKSSGYVMIAADDAIQPILAYSNSNVFTAKDLPANLEWWLDGYKEQIQEVQAKNMPARPEITQQWKNLEIGQTETALLANAVEPLIQTKWDQARTQYNGNCRVYNTYMPLDPDDVWNYPAGCVAIAMAQIMKYHEFPSMGQGSHSYYTETEGTEQSAEFGNTFYDWAAMPDSITCSTNAYSKDQVEQLIYHCGVSVEMDYKVGAGSSDPTMW